MSAADGHTCERPRFGPLVNGVRIDPQTPEQLLAYIDGFLACGRSHVVHFLAAHPTVLARSRPGYRTLLNRGDLNVPDGAPVAVAARLGGFRGAHRQPGTDSLHLVAEWGRARDLGHYLYGGTAEVLDAIRLRLPELHPGVRIADAESPPFREESDLELDASAARMRESGAGVVWIGLGTPKQEIVAERLSQRQAAPVLCCVGAAFDFVAGAKLRAPMWMQETGLEWAHRLKSEPRRLWRRYIVGNPRFVAGVVTDLIRRTPREASFPSE